MAYGFQQVGLLKSFKKRQSIKYHFRQIKSTLTEPNYTNTKNKLAEIKISDSVEVLKYIRYFTFQTSYLFSYPL